MGYRLRFLLNITVSTVEHCLGGIIILFVTSKTQPPDWNNSGENSWSIEEISQVVGLEKEKPKILFAPFVNVEIYRNYKLF